MFCKNCLKEIEAGNEYCPYCGKKVDTLSDDTHRSDMSSEGKGWLSEPEKEEESVFLEIISFFNPLIGAIMYCLLLNRDSGKAYGVYKYSKIGFVVGLIIGVPILLRLITII